MQVVTRVEALQIVLMLTRLTVVACLAFCPLFLNPASAADPVKEVALSDAGKYGTATIGEKTSTPLKEAVAAFNKKLAKVEASQEDAEPNRPAKPIAPPAPLTVDEVVAAIRNWDRSKHPVEESTYELFKEIAATETLPPRSTIGLNTRWVNQGGHEERRLSIRLSAMTGKNQGFEFSIRETEIERRPAYANAAGYRWQVRPRSSARWLSLNDGKIKLRIYTDETNALDVIINRPYDMPGLQVVAFDKDGKRHDLDRKSSAAYHEALTERFHLESSDLPRDKVALLGVEVVTSQDLPRLAAEAKRRAKAQRVEGLPLPQIGQPYDVSLVVDDKRIDSSQWRGKVVLVDFWASWCGACISKMPELKELYAKWHDRGLEVVGVSFDKDASNAQAAIDQLEIPWPSATIIEDSVVDKLWSSRDTVTSLPTVLLIDKQGILRYEIVGSSGKIADKLEELLSEAVKSSE